jgi:hypothetical protein
VAAKSNVAARVILTLALLARGQCMGVLDIRAIRCGDGAIDYMARTAGVIVSR